MVRLYRSQYADAAEVKEKIGSVEGLPESVADFVAAEAGRLEAAIKETMPKFFEGDADTHQPAHGFAVQVQCNATDTLVHIFPTQKEG